MSLRRRLALLVAGAVALTGAAVVVSVYVVVRNQLEAQAEEQLRSAAAVIGPAVTGRGSLPGGPGASAARPPIIPRLIDAQGGVIEARSAGTAFPVTPEAAAVAAGTLGSSLEVLDGQPERFAVLTVPLGSGRALQVAQSYGPLEDVLRRLLRTSLAAGGAILVLAPILGSVVAGGALVPVRRLSRTAERIARTGDLGRRADARGDDELASLAASFNAMLDRLAEMVDSLERAQRAQRQLVADASHELRTPLTTLRTNVELLALGPAAGDAARAELADDTLAQIEDLTALMSQLIDLAREDERDPDRTPVRLDGVVAGVVDRTRPRYPAIDFRADLTATTVPGAEDALARAVSNLLDNAAKWSPEGTTVDVLLRDGVLEVRDRGPGIDEADLPHLFQRFYRGARARGSPGSGLGLAIVGRVVAAHGGKVWAEQVPGGGACLKMWLPAAPAAQGPGTAVAEPDSRSGPQPEAPTASGT